MDDSEALERRLRTAGRFLILGLVTEGVCLMWVRPLAFVVMLGLGGLLCAIGMAVYLYSLVSGSKQD
jgi:hypothetical protein